MFKFYQDFSGVLLKNPTQILIELKHHMNTTKNLRERKLLKNPTKILIELKHYMNPIKNTIEPKLFRNPH